MKILVAEYAVGAGIDEYMLEGRAMLGTLVRSFAACGHEVLYPSAGTIIDSGTAVKTVGFEESLAQLSKSCDAGLVIAPDELLGDLTGIIEEIQQTLDVHQIPCASVRINYKAHASLQVKISLSRGQ